MNLRFVTISIAIILFFQIFSVNCQKDGETLDEYFANTIATLKCRSEEDNVQFSRDQTIDLCVHFIIETTTDTVAKRITYSVNIDEYVALYINQAYNSFKTEYTGSYDIYIVAQAYTSAVNSPVTKYIVDGLVYPLQNLVVTLDSKITKLQWDNGDYTTQEYDDETKNNYVQSAECEDGKNNCNPQIFVSWIGKDDSGNYMTSAGLRMSRFNKYNDKEFWENSIGYFEG
ncbi:hypothetical protein PPERSA_06087 [Pseudocohnilembus persalinus]|uniref:Uncharacterized protein n=1 Tax=Pseudocohnilembus persalinus TaxID=266149 RepID=A0A0V0QVT7_PSEPJ|nr:hypothetical protein PPERSA_06087 [Pseudocohnilembus persalinus]|eukprot:KRX06205.1 hypothetical protein PPERSA_06087 [Pseudocohnilembus persalinus]